MPYSHLKMTHYLSLQRKTLQGLGSLDTGNEWPSYRCVLSFCSWLTSKTKKEDRKETRQMLKSSSLAKITYLAAYLKGTENSVWAEGSSRSGIESEQGERQTDEIPLLSRGE